MFTPPPPPLIGVAVMLPEALQATEGDTFEVCADVMPTIRERDIELTFTVVPSSEFAGIL